MFPATVKLTLLSQISFCMMMSTPWPPLMSWDTPSSSSVILSTDEVSGKCRLGKPSEQQRLMAGWSDSRPQQIARGAVARAQISQKPATSVEDKRISLQ